MFAYRSILYEPPRPAVIRENPRAPWLAVGVVCFGAFMGQLDASIVAITFPAMQREFSAPVAAVQWVSLSYLLGLIAMLAPAGRLGDAAGRKLVYTYGFAVFTAASAACGLAPSLGGDLVLPKAWEDRRRGLAGALLTCVVMGASVVMPVTQATVVPQLALAGLGLGIFVPANNTVIMRGAADSSASLVGGLVSMARGIGTTLGISLMALAWHLGSQSSQAGNHGYSGTEQARPAFVVLAVVAGTAAAIALASRAGARASEAAQEGGPGRCGPVRET
jgi:MFS family permease